MASNNDDDAPLPTALTGGPHHRHPIHTSGSSDSVEEGRYYQQPHFSKQYQRKDSAEASPLVSNQEDPQEDPRSLLQWHHHFSFMGESIRPRDDAMDVCAASLSKLRHNGKLLIFMAATLALIWSIVWWTHSSNSATIWGQNSYSDDDDYHPNHGLNYKVHKHHPAVLLVVDAEEYWLELPPDSEMQDDDDAVRTKTKHTTTNKDDVTLKIWFRTWGRMDGTGIPILFVHGGPGNAIADYFDNGNKRFFQDDDHSYFVVEVDQRGTGNSQPSVRDDPKNMQYYTDISIDKMCHDFEVIREHLGITKWLVWYVYVAPISDLSALVLTPFLPLFINRGGSFGSTLSINYGERYPSSCLALILRGIYLDTAEEVSVIYSRNTYLKHPKRLKEFDILYKYAADYYTKKKGARISSSKNSDRYSEGTDDTTPTTAAKLDPNDAERIMRVYSEMITGGDSLAAWHWFVFEVRCSKIRFAGSSMEVSSYDDDDDDRLTSIHFDFTTE